VLLQKKKKGKNCLDTSQTIFEERSLNLDVLATLEVGLNAETDQQIINSKIYVIDPRREIFLESDKNTMTQLKKPCSLKQSGFWLKLAQISS